jgi:hypothetical protein
MFRQCSDVVDNVKSIQTFQTMLRLSIFCSDYIKNAHAFQNMLIMLWVCSGFSNNAILMSNNTNDSLLVLKYEVEQRRFLIIQNGCG